MILIRGGWRFVNLLTGKLIPRSLLKKNHSFHNPEKSTAAQCLWDPSISKLPMLSFKYALGIHFMIALANSTSKVGLIASFLQPVLWPPGG